MNWRGLRPKTLVVFGLAFLPMAGAAIYTLWLTTHREEDVAFLQVTRWARLVAVNQQQMEHSTEYFLSVLANAEQLRSGNTGACAAQVKQAHESFARYLDVGVVDSTGLLVCSMVTNQRVDLSERDYFRQAMEKRQFVASGYQSRDHTRGTALNFSYPILAADGRVVRVVYAALDLSWVSQWTKTAMLPPGVTVTFLDSRGIIVFREPEAMGWVGRPFTGNPLLEEIRAGKRAARTYARGVDGTRRLYAYTLLERPGTLDPLYIAVGTPESQAFALTYQLRQQAGLLLLLLLGTTLLLGWLLTERLVLRRVYALSEAMDRLRAGDLGARSGVRMGGDELAALAHSFDEMADVLQENHEELLRNDRDNRFLAEASRLLSSSPDHRVTLRDVARLAVTRFADWCSIDLRGGSDGQQSFKYVHHADPAKQRLAATLEERYPARPDDPADLTSEVMRSGKALLIGRLTGEDIARAAQDQEHARLLESLGLRSVLIVPLRAAADSVGTMTLVTAEKDHEFDELDVRLAEELGRRVAMAVENARLYVELEDRVRVRTAELEAANRELEAFSYSVSHDLRSPLRSLDGFSEALAEDYAEVLDHTGKDFLSRIRAAAQRMGLLIDDLLSLARVARREMARAEVDVSALAEAVVRELGQQEPERRVAVSIAPELTANADPGLLRIVLVNLIGNAWKFTARAAEPRIEIGVTEDPGERVFYVRDNGAGFDMAYADKLFGPFQRLHAMTEFAGTGIGLATVQRIIARHGGRIWADAAPGLGATFYFTLEGSHGRHHSAG